MPATPIVELRLLAAPEVRIEGRDSAAVPAQPKRLALLAYLAAATPYGFHRRDTLLALLWPESDQEHARSALRKAVHFLRQDLGREVLVNRGDQELGLASERVWCDVREFAGRLARGALADALTLYQGDLLQGLFVSEAPEFERWLEEERAGLRARAAEAAWTLAGRLEREQKAEEAARWGRWAWARAPDDERGVRRLVLLLARLGDRVGALRTYEEFADRLGREYEAVPSAETRQLVDAVRAGATENGTAPASPLAAMVSPPKDVGAHQQQLFDKSPRQYIAIFPFRVHGDGSAAYLEEGLVDLLSTNLDHVGDLHSIDPHALLNLVAREGRARLDPTSAGELAARFGAELYVLGSVVEVAGQLRINASLHHRSPANSARYFSSSGQASQLFDVVDELTGKLLRELHSGSSGRFTRLAAATTSSLPPLKAYLAGEKAMREARYLEAVEAFQEAVDQDPDFTLAWYRLAFFVCWPAMPQPRAPLEVVERALDHKERLSQRNRLLLEALTASLQGASSQAERLYEQILAIHPDEVEAWMGLAQTLSIHNQLHGRLIAESRGPFERVLALDPGNTTANVFLAYISELEGAFEESDRRIAAMPAESDFVLPRIVQAFRRGDREMQEQGMAFLRTAPDVVVHESARFVATLTLDFAGARRIAHLLAEPGRSDEARGTYHVLAAFLDLTVGSWSGARRELLAAAPHQPASALEYRGLLAILPFLPVPDGELEALRELLTEWKAPASSPGTNPFPTLDLHHDAHAVVRLYLLGALGLRLGHPTAMAYAAELDAVAGSPDAEALARDLAHSLRARHAGARGEYAVALAELERARIEPRQVLAASSPPFYIRTAERWLRAELLQQLGRYGEALRWYRCVCQSSLYDLIYLAPAHLRRAEIHERLGEPGHASEHYRRFLELWQGCDLELQPMLDRAASRLEQLERAGSPRHAGRGSRIG